MVQASETRQIQEQTILGILTGKQPLNLTRPEAGELLVKTVSAQPGFQRDISGQPISAGLLESRVRDKVQDFRTKCLADPTQIVCSSFH